MHVYDFIKNNIRTVAVHEVVKRMLSMKNFDLNKMFSIYSDGATSQNGQPKEKQIRKILKLLPNNHLIVVNYCQFSNNTDGEMKSYIRSVKCVHQIGIYLIQMLVELHKRGISAKYMEYIWYSLEDLILGQLSDYFLKHQNVQKPVPWAFT